MRSKYYIRIKIKDGSDFEEHLKRNGVIGEQLSVDLGPKNGSILYAVCMESEEALNLKLSFPVMGFMNFKKALDKQLDKQ